MTVQRRLTGIVFDMDGTLTVPCIDFAEMRRRVGVLEGDILTVIGSWSEERRAEAHRVLRDFELQALADMQVMPGAVELCSLLDARGVPRGIITRNVKSSVDHFHQHHFPLPPFSPALSRECALYKPSPEPLLRCCEVWGVPPHEVAIIGDSAKDDIVCGNRAGAVTILLDSLGQYEGAQLSGEQRPTFQARTLSEVMQLLDAHFELAPPAGAALMASQQQQQQQQRASTVGGS